MAGVILTLRNPPVLKVPGWQRRHWSPDEDSTSFTMQGRTWTVTCASVCVCVCARVCVRMRGGGG